ncbi:hypothetical protein SASPL_103625 [Salvia splendens]|uniref:HhH-GPD domain-containing protein n=1 Tax=Salvia splendens TaxID=180675 RepID=A0A8X8YK19_SALSN|nr:hypothetical protein SASPL_103625 [Salvia splendens]
MRKRKQSSAESPKTTVNSSGAAGKSPFPDHSRPTHEECLSVRDELLSLHGFPPEFLKYRNQRLEAKSQLKKAKPLEDEGEKDGIESVLDGLVKTILSQNTTELNSDRAFASLRKAFPTWQHVLEAESKHVEDAIRCGGLAPTKSSCIKNLLSVLLEKRGKLCMEYLREMSIEEVKAELSLLKGIGPKTLENAKEVLLQIFQIAKGMGWVPGVADVKTTYLHLNQRIPPELKFDLNCLLYTHGKACRRCSYRKVGKKNKEAENSDCPLLAYSEGCKFENESLNLI